MNTEVKRTRAIRTVITLLLGVTLSLPGMSAFAWQRATTVAGPNGQSISRVTNRSAGNVSSTVTGTNGRVWNRSVERQPGSTAASVTGPNGQTVTRTSTYQQ